MLSLETGVEETPVVRNIEKERIKKNNKDIFCLNMSNRPKNCFNKFELQILEKKTLLVDKP
jgi:hypothetical protein